jgi:CRP/FNR family transcriptional regulator
MTLEKFPFFGKMDTQAHEFLKTHLKPIDVPEGTLLFEEGDICDGVLFLNEGSIEVYKGSGADKKVLYHVEPGSQCIVNVASTLSQTKAIASATTRSDISGFLLDMYSLRELARNSFAYQEYIFALYRLDFLDEL